MGGLEPRDGASGGDTFSVFEFALAVMFGGFDGIPGCKKVEGDVFVEFGLVADVVYIVPC